MSTSSQYFILTSIEKDETSTKETTTTTIDKATTIFINVTSELVTSQKTSQTPSTTEPTTQEITALPLKPNPHDDDHHNHILKLALILSGCLLIAVVFVLLIYLLRKKMKLRRRRIRGVSTELGLEGSIRYLKRSTMQKRDNSKVNLEASGAKGGSLKFKEESIKIIRPQSLPFDSVMMGTFGKKTSKSRLIKLNDFHHRITQMHKDHEFMFQAEFDRLSEISTTLPRDKSNLTGMEEEFIKKNRFIDVLPYEESRVKFENDDGYINANYIDGYNKPKEYIATQGPISPGEERQGRKESTFGDFWRMIWEQNSRTIIMLTQCVEMFRFKCGHYWPREVNESETYWGFTVTLLNQIDRDLCIERTMILDRVKTGEETDEEPNSHIISQFHYKSWEDNRGLDAMKLVNFVEFLRTSGKMRTDREIGPVIIHCSAGVGRTGTLIALDCLLQHIKENDNVDVLGCVYSLREQRVRMVQNVEQYTLIYDSLDVAISKQLEQRRDEDEDGLQATPTSSRNTPRFTAIFQEPDGTESIEMIDQHM